MVLSIFTNAITSICSFSRDAAIIFGIKILKNINVAINFSAMNGSLVSLIVVFKNILISLQKSIMVSERYAIKRSSIQLIVWVIANIKFFLFLPALVSLAIRQILAAKIDKLHP